MLAEIENRLEQLRAQMYWLRSQRIAGRKNFIVIDHEIFSEN